MFKLTLLRNNLTCIRIESTLRAQSLLFIEPHDNS